MHSVWYTCTLTNSRAPLCPNLELGGDLADEGNELLQVLGLAVLEHVLGGGGDEGQHLFLQADDHAVEEGAHGAAQGGPLHWAAQRRQESVQAVAVHLRAAARLHRLLVAEGLAGAAEGGQRRHAFIRKTRQKNDS